MASVVYDTGALLGAERQQPEVIQLHDRLIDAGIRPIVPVVVLVQSWRGGPQHRPSKLLKGCLVLPDDERIGRAAGIACAGAGMSDVVDAIVVVTAAARAAMVVTSDPDDICCLADAIGVKLRLFPV
jgi:hypothetical protein